MSKRKSMQIYSIFGQIEEVVARAMIAEGKTHLIGLESFPLAKHCPDVWINKEGTMAKFAIMLNGAGLAEFNRRVAELRA
jgi:hypothetical protein